MDLTRWRELRWQASALRANIQLKTQSPGTAFGKHTPTWIRSLERCNSWVKSGRHCRDGRRLARRSHGPAPRTVSSAGVSSFDRGDHGVGGSGMSGHALGPFKIPRLAWLYKP